MGWPTEISGGPAGGRIPLDGVFLVIKRLSWFVLILVFVGLLGITLILGKPTGSVDWRALRAVALESDDWGLQGFIPAADSWEGLDRAGIAPGSFPEVYWSSTLEDSTMVADLCLVMSRVQGRDGLPAVFQPNYVMSGLGWLGNGGDGAWHRFDLPDLDPRYHRPGLWRAVGEGIHSGVWYPEFHATWHYDPALRKAAALQPGDAAKATGRGIMLFPGSERARELGLWRESADLTGELDHSLEVFQRIFGRLPGSVIAPDYTWSARHEDLWESRGLRVIQAKREQRNPEWGGSLIGRLAKAWGRSLERVDHPDRTYLERNCRFEPVQTEDPAAVVSACLEETRQAWRRSEPAIVETHRINFVHTDPAVVETGLNSLADYLEELTRPGEFAPIFLTDWEISQLQGHGTSWCVRSGRVVVRNGTRSSRLMTVPVEALNRAQQQGDLRSTPIVPLLVVLRAGQTRILGPEF